MQQSKCNNYCGTKTGRGIMFPSQSERARELQRKGKHKLLATCGKALHMLHQLQYHLEPPGGGKVFAL